MTYTCEGCGDEYDVATEPYVECETCNWKCCPNCMFDAEICQDCRDEELDSDVDLDDDDDDELDDDDDGRYI